MNEKEHKLQEACFSWHSLQYPNHLVFHVPNSLKFIGSNRNRGAFFRELQRLKKRGLVPGIPDLFLTLAVYPYHGLFTELKIDNNKPSKDQLRVHKMIQEAGFCIKVCKTLDQYIKATTGYLNGSDEKFMDAKWIDLCTVH